jgi:hypothetical protein
MKNPLYNYIIAQNIKIYLIENGFNWMQ